MLRKLNLMSQIAQYFVSMLPTTAAAAADAAVLFAVMAWPLTNIGECELAMSDLDMVSTASVV